MPVSSTPILLQPDQMVSSLQQALPNFRHIEWVERTASTNGDLLARARSDGQSMARPWLLGAHMQESGRGRAGRTWQNRSGANLMFSCAFDIFLSPKQLPTLSPLAGVAACEALRELIGPAHRDRLIMKWPNDVYWQFSKLAGILVEITRGGTARQAADHHVVIVGIGINLEDARALSQSLNRQIADWSEIAAQDILAATASTASMVAAVARSWSTSFNHIDRTLVVTHGGPMLLVNTNTQEQYDLPRWEPYRFRGETAITARLPNGPTQDFNLMCRRGACIGQLDLRESAQNLSLQADSTFLHCATGSFSITLSKPAPAVYTLQTGDTLHVTLASPAASIRLGSFACATQKGKRPFPSAKFQYDHSHDSFDRRGQYPDQIRLGRVSKRQTRNSRFDTRPCPPRSAASMAGATICATHNRSGRQRGRRSDPSGNRILPGTELLPHHLGKQPQGSAGST